MTVRLLPDGAADAAVPLPLTDHLADPASTAVRLGPADDPRALMPGLDRLALIEVGFGAFRDGRGFSTARILREAGYRGELRAVGDILLDQVVLLHRAGFDAFAPTRPLDPAAVAAALARFPAVYQVGADGRPPAWALRDG